MQPASQQPYLSRNSVAYRPFFPAQVSIGTRNSAYAFVAAAASLGLMFGLILAFLTGNGKAAAAPQDSASVQSHASGLKTLPASYTGPVTSLLSQVDPQKKESAGPALPSPVSEQSAPNAGARKKHGINKLWNWMKGSGKNQTAGLQSGVSPSAPAALEAATRLEPAASTAAPFLREMQGDATIAGYDAGTGSIETHEGQTFILDKPAGETSAIDWPDFPFDVHYRCDQTGDCTLLHGGASASAKLTR